ncbi:MAG: PD-(D/E)XK nuclease family protein [Patescibacteria group bacterium]|nr:PD-(D/E)XK nuclease family protein [Patescibacteria group bacterium]
MINHRPNTFVKDALFLSHTSLNDFLICPRTFFLKNVYRSPKTGYKIQITSPFLALGATIHDTIKWYLEIGENSSLLKTEDQFRNHWWKYHGKRGGFVSREEEAAFGTRGLKMLENFTQNQACLGSRIPLPVFPKYPLSEGVILHGNMDYIGKLSDGSLQVIDFKTGSKDEDNPMQLYIYAILAENYFRKEVSRASFWYLDRDDNPKEVVLDSLEAKIDWLTQRGQEIKKAIEENNWQCIQGESLCRDCRDYGAILEGKGELVFIDHAYKKEIYFLKK